MIKIIIIISIELVDNNLVFYFSLLPAPIIFEFDIITMYNQPYQTEISFAIGWRIFLTVISIPLAIVFGWLIYDGFTGSTGIFGIICGPIGSLFFGYCVIRVFKEKVIIEEDKLMHVRAFTQKEVLYQDIEGYRVDDNYIYLESFQTKKRLLSYQLTLVNQKY